MMLHINSLIKTTKADLVEAERAHRRIREAGMNDEDRSKESWDQLRRRRKCLVDARRYIVDHDIEPIASGLHDAPLLAINGLITENKGVMAEVMREFHHVHRGDMNDKMNSQSTVLWDRHLLLQGRHKRLMETRRYILDLTLSASSRRS
jgi:hypothetical protein